MMIMHCTKIKRPKMFSVVAVVFAFAAVGMFFVEYVDSVVLNYGNPQSIEAPQGPLEIVIKVPGRVLELYNDGKLFKRYRIAVGKPGTPSPIGEWKIVYKSYSPEAKYGTRWMGLDVPWGSYGIHGTNMPWSIGCFASHGCIRMRNRDVEELYEWIPLGTPVKVVGQRDRITRELRRGASGTDVVTLQLRLIELGYYQDRASGRFNKDTEAAVRAYQRDHREKETGVVDRNLLKKLGL